MVLYFKTETEQVAPEVDKREFAFILISTKNDNDSIPNYDLISGVPDFTKSNWSLLNPMSYFLQDLVGMKKVVKEVFNNILSQHIQEEHGLIGAVDIERNLVKKDYSNLMTPFQVGKYSLEMKESSMSNENGTIKMFSNGIMEYQMAYSFDSQANPMLKINDRKYYYQKSPIWDESDQSIFA